MNRYDKDNNTKIIKTAKTISGDVLTILSLLREIPLRLNEVLYLEKNSMEYDGEIYSLYYSKSKTLQPLEIKTCNQDKLGRCAISKKAFDLLTKQQEKTDEMYPQNKYIFVTGNQKFLSSVQFKSRIKELLIANNMENSQIKSTNYCPPFSSCLGLKCSNQHDYSCAFCMNFEPDLSPLK